MDTITIKLVLLMDTKDICNSKYNVNVSQQEDFDEGEYLFNDVSYKFVK